LYVRLGLRSLAPFLALPACAQILIHGAGATFPYPVYARWFDEFHKLHPEAHINYQPIGSGGGLRQLEAGVVDFGASDRPPDAADRRFLHFPTMLGAVVPIYNLPQVNKAIDFTPEALTGVFLGKIRKWNDPALAKVNPGVKLPDAGILPVHRADGSGTTYLWTAFLSRTVPEWRDTVGSGMSVHWPLGLGGKGNAGVAALVQQTEFSIGYVELTYAAQNRIAYGRVRNHAGRFVKPDLKSIVAATRGSSEDSMADPADPAAYPVAGYTWLLTPARIEDPAKRRAIAAFLTWALTDGQRMVEPLGYAPLPADVAARAIESVKRLQ
jgi:phosphate transport system substrate-binding protein